MPEGVRVVSAAELSAGRRAWFHDELAGHRWRISARSFFQARADGAEALVDAVGRATTAPCPPAGHLVDLYGGVGLFARHARAPTGPVTLVEQSASSAADARVNLDGLDARVVRADVDHWGAAHADVVVADPPRTGLGAQGGRQGRRHPRRPGGPRELRPGRARARRPAPRPRRATTSSSCQLVDLFPHTSHVEVVSRFDRR